MINSLKVKRKDGEIIEIKLRELKLSDINKIIKLQELIINGLENKELYAGSKQEEFEEYINCNGKIIGCLTNEDELIAMGVYAKKGYDESNYAYDIGLNGEEVLKVAQIESTIVKSEYRGNKLQRLICEELEKIAPNTFSACTGIQGEVVIPDKASSVDIMPFMAAKTLRMLR